VTTAWADALVTMGVIPAFECPTIIDKYAADHPEAEMTKAMIQPTLELAFMGMQELFFVGGIYSLPEMYASPIYQQYSDLMDEGIQQNIIDDGLTPEVLADNVIANCKAMVF